MTDQVSQWYNTPLGVPRNRSLTQSVCIASRDGDGGCDVQLGVKAIEPTALIGSRDPSQPSIDERPNRSRVNSVFGLASHLTAG